MKRYVGRTKKPSDGQEVRLYMSTSMFGQDKSQMGADIYVGTDEAPVPAETLRDPYTHMTVYTMSSLVEQTTPANIHLIRQATFSYCMFFVSGRLSFRRNNF